MKKTGDALTDRLVAVVKDGKRWGCTDEQIVALLKEELAGATSYDKARVAEALQMAMRQL